MITLKQILILVIYLPKDVKWAGWTEIREVKIGSFKNQVKSSPAQIYFGLNCVKIGS